MILLVILVSPLIKILFAQHISSRPISKSCFQNIRDPRRIRNTIDQTNACTIATSLIHYKIDYCNSHLLNLPAIQTNRLQFVVNVMQTGPSVIKLAAVVRDLGVMPDAQLTMRDHISRTAQACFFHLRRSAAFSSLFTRS